MQFTQRNTEISSTDTIIHRAHRNPSKLTHTVQHACSHRLAGEFEFLDAERGKKAGSDCIVHVAKSREWVIVIAHCNSSKATNTAQIACVRR